MAVDMIRSCYRTTMIFMPASWPNPGVPVAGPALAPHIQLAGEELGPRILSPATGRLGFGAGQKGGWPFPVKWFFCKPGVKLLPFPTAFVSANWDSDPEWNTTLGEPHHWNAQPYSNGLAPLSAFGQKFCGTADQFLTGINAYCGTRYDAFGLPVCCSGTVAAGSIGLTRFMVPAPLGILGLAGVPKRVIVSAIGFGPSIALPPASGQFVLTSFANTQKTSFVLSPNGTGVGIGSIAMASPVIAMNGGGADIGFSGLLPAFASGLVMTGVPVPFNNGAIVLSVPAPSGLYLAAFTPASGRFGLTSSVTQSREFVVSQSEQGSGHMVLGGNLPQAGKVVLASVIDSGAANSAIVFTPFTPFVPPTNLLGLASPGPQEGRIGLTLAQSSGLGLSSPLDCLSGCYTDPNPPGFQELGIVSNSMQVLSGGFGQALFFAIPQTGTRTYTFTFTMPSGFFSFLFSILARTDCTQERFAEASVGFESSSPLPGPGFQLACQDQVAGNQTPWAAVPPAGDTLQLIVTDTGTSIKAELFDVTAAISFGTLTYLTVQKSGPLAIIEMQGLVAGGLQDFLVKDGSTTVWHDDFHDSDQLLYTHKPNSGCIN